jgi:sulfur carrier protein ThiS
MKIFLDGQELQLSHEQGINFTVADIVSKLDLKLGHLAVRINNHYISRKEIGVRKIDLNDEIELINMYAGG